MVLPRAAQVLRANGPRNAHRAVYLSLCIILFRVASANAQYRFDSYTTDNGLPQNSIRAIVQTHDGYLWFTTRDGLLHFDGVHFRIFNTGNTPGLPSNEFNFYCLLEDRSGALWMGSSADGAIRYHDGIFTSYTTRDGLPNNHIVRIDEDADGAIWISTDPGLSRWKAGQLVRIAPLPGSPFNRFLLAPKQVGVDGLYFGLWRLGPSGWERFAHGKWSHLPLPPHTDPAKLKINSIIEDSRHRLWFNMYERPGESYRVSNGNLTVFKGLPRGAFACYEDRRGYVWLANHNGQNALWKGGRVISLPGPSTHGVFRVLEDSEGGLWIGTSNEGLYHLREQVITFYRAPGSRGAAEIHAIMQNPLGEIWIGGISGLTRFNVQKSQNFRVDRLWAFSNIISALHEDSDGTIWAGTWDGIARFERGRLHQESGLSGRSRVV